VHRDLRERRVCQLEATAEREGLDAGATAADRGQSGKPRIFMSAYAFPNNMRYLFAFSHSIPTLPRDASPRTPRPSKYNKFELAAEYDRMGVSSSPLWRITQANESYKLCNTYPRRLCVPRGVSDEELFAIGNNNTLQYASSLSFNA
jgi:hypothetical protein